ncbi:unnamed protein product [Prorocentrum cordatum]|uniref:F-box domain-containing protein n=1 Tax=Prorocentrum cordatum TaxID=2364126 RepID=A0ABN9RED9_9DINO|nr:unnamed protein product [Polarella glacialis]
MAGAGTEAFFWRLPLPGPPLQPCEDLPDGPAAAFFWRLPPAALAEERRPPREALQDTPERRPGAAASSGAELLGEASAERRPGAPASDERGAEGSSGAERGAEASAERRPGAPASAERRPSLAEEMVEMLDRCAAERQALQRNLADLGEQMERLRSLTAQAGRQRSSDDARGAPPRREAEPAGPGGVPSEVVGRVLWCLDFHSLAQATCACPEWAGLARSEGRWAWLFEADWGVQAAGSRQEYRRWLCRWRGLKSTLSGLRGSACPSGICGSHARRQLFEALECLVELGAAEEPGAHYPSHVRGLLREVGGGDTLLALLEDESPHLMCLAARCLADLASDAEERPRLRAEIVQRGALVRSLLEGEDADVVEASARMMINLHGSAPGTPLGMRRRGPAAFLWSGGGCAGGFLEHGARGSSGSAWAGTWAGEMQYARGGERHASLRLLMGPRSDPAVARALEALRAAQAGRADAAAGEHGGQRPRMRAEGNADFWNFFGFLAASDFDGPVERAQYVDEQMRRRREVGSPSHGGAGAAGRASATDGLVGAGWDEQNGGFTVEAAIPCRVPGSPGGAEAATPPALASAVPLRLRLRYESRGDASYELTGFLADGRDADNGHRVPALYGVWATAPSQHKHLFVLHRVAALQDLL